MLRQPFRLKRVLLSLLSLIGALAWGLLGGAVLLGGLPVEAARWGLIAESADGRVAQYVDWDSLERRGALVMLESYATENAAKYPTGAIASDRPSSQTAPSHPSEHPVTRVDYTTLYDCDRQQFKDLRFNDTRLAPPWDPNAELSWAATQPDPLNHAVMQAVCSAPD